MEREEFTRLRLVGGTALALQTGHRKSIDLDLFGEINFEEIDPVQIFGGFEQVGTIKRSKNINILSINGIKVDFVNYSYPWLQDQIVEEGIRIAGKHDIAAMKLAAVTGRGTRKDFVDLFYLLKEFDLRELVRFYNQKYFDGSEYLVLKSLTYFDDAEEDLELEMLKPVSWEGIKEYILRCVQQYMDLQK
jgi:hypothetical protein